MDELHESLDIKSKNVLKAALKNLVVLLLTVSHDRFLAGMSIWCMNSKTKNKEYLGDINYFLEQRNMENMREVEKKRCAETCT
jgi:ATP-binding cassette subfamily F protein 3